MFLFSIEKLNAKVVTLPEVSTKPVKRSIYHCFLSVYFHSELSIFFIFQGVYHNDQSMT